MSGMRPTGRLHLGHYMGVLNNWTALQGDYDCFFMIADLHALTTKYDETDALVDNIYEMALDWLAAGVDPERATLYVQSAVPEITQLHLLLSMLTPSKWVETDPTLKDMVQMLRKTQDEVQEEKELPESQYHLNQELSYGLLGYPVLQTADILMMRGELVPVGKDQLAHLEISRDIARRFNYVYQTDLFPEPRPLLTEVPMLKGLDGRKMGKSFNNAIYLSDSADETWQKVRTAITDPARVKRDDPGNPLECEAIYPYYEVFATQEATALAAQECRTAQRGCVDCKKILTGFVNERMAPIRERRATFAADRAQVDAILRAGNEKARETAAATLARVKDVMKLFA
jgi:tryptophanyl-tRNA synthetase